MDAYSETRVFLGYLRARVWRISSWWHGRSTWCHSWNSPGQRRSILLPNTKPHVFGRTWNVRRMAPEVDCILDHTHIINHCQMLFMMNVRVDFEVHIWNDKVRYHVCTWWTRSRGKSGITPRLSKVMAYHCEALRPMVTGLPTLITAAILGHLSGSQIRLVRAVTFPATSSGGCYEPSANIITITNLRLHRLPASLNIEM